MTSSSSYSQSVSSNSVLQIKSWNSDIEYSGNVSDSDEIIEMDNLEKGRKVSDTNTTENIANGIFAKEYKAMFDEIKTSENNILTWSSENSQSENSWKSFFRKHRSKLIKAGYAAIGIGLADIIATIASAIILRNSIPMAGYVASCSISGSLILGGATSSLYNALKLDREQNGIDTDLEELVKDYDVKKEIFANIVARAEKVEQFYLDWKSFEDNPSEEKINSLFDSLFKIKVSKKPRYHENEYPIVTSLDKFYLMDEICKKLKTGKIVTEWEEYKSSSTLEVLQNKNFNKAWHSLKIQAPLKQEAINYLVDKKKQNRESIVPSIIERAKEIFTFYNHSIIF